MRRHARWLLVPLLSLALLAPAGVIAAAATTSHPTPAPAPDPAAMRQAFAERLAANLGGGVTAGQVVAAMDKLRQSPPAQGGYLTAMASALNVSPDRLATALMATRLQGGGTWRARRMHHGGLLKAAAAYLGMSEDAVRAELAKGRSLAQIAQGAGKTSKGLEDALAAAARQRIHEVVGRSWAPKAMTRAASQTPAAP